MDSEQVSDGQVSNGLKDLLPNGRNTVVAQWARYSCEKSNFRGTTNITLPTGEPFELLPWCWYTPASGHSKLD